MLYYWTVHVCTCAIQQEQVLTELMMYTTGDPVPVDAPLVKCTLKYLSACNLLFERGILSWQGDDKRQDHSGEYEYRIYLFSDWLKSLLDEGMLFSKIR